MDENLKRNLSATHVWLRLVYIIITALVLYIALAVFWVSSLVQFLFALITAERNLKLAVFCDVLCQYINQCTRFISFCSEDKPFPFAELPESDLAKTVVADEQSSEIEAEEIDAEVADAGADVDNPTKDSEKE